MKTLVEVKNPLESNFEMFKRYSLLQAFDNMYQKIDLSGGLDQAFETMYNLALKNPTIMPKAAYYPAAFNTDNTFNAEKLQDPTKKEDILASIRRYVDIKLDNLPSYTEQNDKDIARLYILYSDAFQSPLQGVQSLESGIKYSKFKSVKGSPVNYLTTEYEAEFFQEILGEKQKDSYLYNNALKYFKITDVGIDVRPIGKQTEQQILTLLPNKKVYNNLKKYSTISKNRNLNFI